MNEGIERNREINVLKKAYALDLFKIIIYIYFHL